MVSKMMTGRFSPHDRNVLTIELVSDLVSGLSISFLVSNLLYRVKSEQQEEGNI